jgi:peptidoglycan/LPS O-acetylase OafA/YrhL
MNKADSNVAHLRYRPDIDGLRAVAVTSVVAYHVGIPFISGGFIGVDVFFVISGYLIGSIIYKGVIAGEFSYADFYARRARRILPALICVLLLSSVLAGLILTPSELARFSGSATAAALAASNWFFFKRISYFWSAANLNPLLMTWSLGVEEQFYFVFPFIMTLVYRRWANKLSATVITITALSFVLSIFLVKTNPAAAFYLLPSRAWELGAGTLLAIFEIRRPAFANLLLQRFGNWFAVIGAAMIVVSIVTLNAGVPFPGLAALLPIVGTVLLIGARGSVVNAGLSTSPIIFIGKISYSWYLWHWPLLSFARVAADGRLPLSSSIIIGALSFLIAVASYYFIETPFRASRGTRRVVLTRYAVALGTVVAATLMLHLHGGWPQRFSPQLSDMEKATLSVHDACLVDYGVVRPRMMADCVAPEDGRPELALVGDSHAAALAPAFRTLASTHGYGFVQLTKVACVGLFQTTRRMSLEPRQESECLRFNDASFQFLQRPSIRIVVLADRWTAPTAEELEGTRYVRAGEIGRKITEEQSRENFRAGLTQTISVLHDLHKKVVVVQDVPVYLFDPLLHLETSYVPTRKYLRSFLARSPEIDEYSAPAEDLETDDDNFARNLVSTLFAKSREAYVFDPLSVLCHADRCMFGDASGAFYRDPQHLSASGASIVARALEPRLFGSTAKVTKKTSASIRGHLWQHAINIGNGNPASRKDRVR